MHFQHHAYIALGSNLNQPVQQVLQAFQAIAALPQSQLMRQSSLYQTAPEGYDNQPDFINAAVHIQTNLSPTALMQHLLEIEQNFGRERSFANAPRVLDCDLLLFDDLSLNSDLLILPHPRMHLRGFVLLPLAEIAPDLSVPKHGSVVKLAQSYTHLPIKKLALTPSTH